MAITVQLSNRPIPTLSRHVLHGTSSYTPRTVEPDSKRCSAFIFAPNHPRKKKQNSYKHEVPNLALDICIPSHLVYQYLVGGMLFP
ncbi:unnamed protein product [Urochloa humidicola]